MPSDLLLGPLLGYEQGDCYTVCFLADIGLAVVPLLRLSTGDPIAFTHIADTPSGRFWRAEAILPRAEAAQTITYRIFLGDVALVDRAGWEAWSFHVPALGENARLAYAACNGFSSPDLAAATAHPFVMWERMRREHLAAPFSLLLLGGDQLYADAVLSLKGVQEWTERSHDEMLAFEPSNQLIARLDRFYDELYRQRWSEPHTALMLASIPSVMMWDDHDIVDGWGSHDDIPQCTPLYRAIYAAARKYFQLYQLRTAANRSLLDPDQLRLNPGSGHFAQGFDFADFKILVMDHRSERTLTQVMSDAQHQAVKQWLAAVPPSPTGTPPRPVLALSGIPVVYRSFAGLESTMEFTPWTEEATDDVRDHWMAAHHRGERTRLLKNLFACPAPVWLLSGDVHVGALGAIHDAESGKSIYQVISTGIVHPPPSAIEWAGLCFLTNDRPEKIPGTGLSTEMLTPSNGPRYLRDRNFATFQRDAKGKLWVHWICENPASPLPPEFVA